MKERRIRGGSFGKEMHVFTLLERVKIGTFGARAFAKNGGAWRLVRGAGSFLFGVEGRRWRRAGGGVRRGGGFGKELRVITLLRGRVFATLMSTPGGSAAWFGRSRGLPESVT